MARFRYPRRLLPFGADRTPMLARLVVLMLALALGGSSGAAPTPAETTTSTTFVVSGHGYGHGVGMSQWGAYGYALNGASYDQILAHYYPGTRLGPAPTSKVRVLLTEKRRKLAIGSDADYELVDGTGKARAVPAGTLTLTPSLKVQLDPSKPAETLQGPLTFAPGEAPIHLRNPYRGTVQVSVVDGKLQAVNTLGLEAYLYGVVPREVPSDWPPEALEAQAVAARSYALVERRPQGAFDLYADQRSQVYGGIGAEQPSTTAAVDATKGQVLLYGGDVALTYFFSSSGGRTAAVTDVWPDAPPEPYLVSVDDPYDAVAPYHDWGPALIPAALVAKKLKVAGPVTDVRATPGPAGRVQEVVVVGRAGETTLPASAARIALGLRSTWFDVGLLSLTGPAEPVVYGSRATLTGLVRGVENASLEQRTPAGWQPVPTAPAPAADGSLSLLAKPLATTAYRLSLGDAAGAVFRLRVAPRVRLARAGDGALSGSARPLLPGATVEIQRLDEATGAWAAVTSTALDGTGAFAAQLAVAPGSYRARIAPVKGYAAGLSPVLQVASS